MPKLILVNGAAPKTLRRVGHVIAKVVPKEANKYNLLINMSISLQRAGFGIALCMGFQTLSYGELQEV